MLEDRNITKKLLAFYPICVVRIGIQLYGENWHESQEVAVTLCGTERALELELGECSLLFT